MKQFSYKNTQIAYTDQGKGSTIFLLHGFLENLSMWHVIAPHLAKKNRVVCVDLLGHGQSSCLGYVHTMEDQADMIHALMSHLRLRKISLVGHSMGGYIALAFAELYPDHVRKLVLINSSARPDSAERQLNRDRAIKAVKQNSDLFIQLAVSNLFMPERLKKHQVAVNQLIKDAKKTPTQGVIAALEGMKIRPDREVLLHFGPYPKLLIAGEHDTIIPISEVKSQVETTDTKLVILECGHMATIEAEQDVIEKLTAFFK